MAAVIWKMLSNFILQPTWLIKSFILLDYSRKLKKKKKLYVQEVSEGQLANNSASCGTLHSEVVGGADGEGLTTHPPSPLASPRACQIYELSGAMGLRICVYITCCCSVLVWGLGSHKALCTFL